MRIAVIASVILAVTSFAPLGAGQSSKKSIATDAKLYPRDLSKGGIGIISEELYVVVKSSKADRNELIVRSPANLGKDQSAPTQETRWRGRTAGEAEIAIFFRGRVWSPESLPQLFDMSKAIVVSFESDKVRYFDFNLKRGAYFERIEDKR